MQTQIPGSYPRRFCLSKLENEAQCTRVAAARAYVAGPQTALTFQLTQAFPSHILHGQVTVLHSFILGLLLPPTQIPRCPIVSTTFPSFTIASGMFVFISLNSRMAFQKQNKTLDLFLIVISFH